MENHHDVYLFFMLRQHRIIWQEHSAKDFASYESYKRGCLIKSQPLCKMHSSNSRAVHFAPPAGGLLNAQGAQGRPLHTSPAKFLCIFLSCCYFETTRFSTI